jgi:hypothetical protein
MSRRFPLGWVLLSADGKSVWCGPGLLPLARRLPRRPPVWEDRQDALRAADALLRGPLRLALKAERCFAAC